MKNVKRMPDFVEFRTLGITMTGREAYTTTRSFNGLIGFRKNNISIDRK